jgi:hypothetical protein
MIASVALDRAAAEPLPASFDLVVRMVEIILSEHQLACRKAAVPTTSGHAAFESGATSRTAQRRHLTATTN